MLFFVVAAMATDVILIRVYSAMGWDAGMRNLFQQRMKPWQTVVLLLAAAAGLNLLIQTGLSLLHANTEIKAIAMGIGLGAILSLLPAVAIE